MTATGSPDAVAFRQVSKSYGGHVALEPLTLTIPAGERVSLIGHNGSGKTTLLQLIAGRIDPSAGDVSVAGHDPHDRAARAAVSHLADQPVFYDDLSVWEHLEFVARLHATVDWVDHASWLVEMLGLTERVDDLPVTFSRGLQQKAALALGFVRPFDVLLIDEPFVGLDRRGRAALLELLDWAHGDGATVVVATHELASVRAGSRLIALADGRLTFDGAPDEADVDALADGDVSSDVAETGGGETDGGESGDAGPSGDESTVDRE